MSRRLREAVFAALVLLGSAGAVRAGEPASPSISRPASMAASSRPASMAASRPASAPVPFAVRIADLEARVAALKERIGRRGHRHAPVDPRSSELGRTTPIPKARVRVALWDRTSGAFAIDSVRFGIAPTGVGVAFGLGGGPTAWGAPLPPGRHSMDVLITLRGKPLGPFRYLDAYTFRLSLECVFTVAAGEEVSVGLLVWERTGFTRAWADRPAARCVVERAR